MKRLLAVIAAAIMILAAVLIRGILDGDNPFDGSEQPGRTKDELPTLLCVAELIDACKAIGELGIATVTTANPGTTVDQITSSQQVDFDLWLTVGPWDQILEDNLRYVSDPPKTPLLGTSSEVLARSPVVLVTLNQGATQSVIGACPNGPAVYCATTVPGLKVGLAAPRRGDGLAMLSQAVSNRVTAMAESENLPYSGFDKGDLESGELSSWIAGLAATSNSAGLGSNSPLYVAITKAGQFQAVGALEADAADLLGDGRNTLVSYPQPIVTADVRLVPRQGAKVDQLVDQDGIAKIKEVLAGEGWRVDGRIPQGVNADAPDLPDDNGLAEPGVLQVLRHTWGKGG